MYNVHTEGGLVMNLELPQGERTRLYRFFEILPGGLSYAAVIALFVVSWINPILGAIYVLVIVAITFVKAIATAFRTIQGYKVMKEAEKVDWAGKLRKLAAEKDLGMKPEGIYHAVIMVAYNEGLEILGPSVEAVRETSFPNERIIFVLGYEERGGEAMEQNALELQKRFKGVFKEFLLVKHPKDVEGEIVGKGPNLTCAGKALAEYVAETGLPKENIIVTSLDSDNRMSRTYLDYVAYEFWIRPDRQHYSYQPISIFTNNIWEAAAPMRVVAMSNSFFNVVTTMRPHLLKNFASHSQPLMALEGMDFWSKRTIVEDGHQYWRSLFYFDGKYSVVPIHVPIYQDAVMAETLRETLKAQFIQLRRWDYGASDVAYVGVRLFSRKWRKEHRMKFMPLWVKFWRLLDGHVTLAIMAPIVAFGGWVPMLLNMSSRGVVAWSLPNVVGMIQMVAMGGLVTAIVVSLKTLPEKPKRLRGRNKLMMITQWVLSPVIAIVYQSAAAFYAQTRLMTGKYMERFDVTKKVKKSA